MSGLPVEITASPAGVVRPFDLRRVYSNPAKEVGRLVKRGVLLRLSHGYFAVVPERFRGTNWRPTIEAIGLAIGQADYGRNDVAGMGVTAARLLGAIPRAVGEAIIAVRKQRPALVTSVGPVRFITRDLTRLELQRAETELADAWITTAEQTVLDLADRPALGHLDTNEIASSIRLLARNLDWQRVQHLAIAQRKQPAATRAAWVAGADPIARTGRRVSTLGLLGASGAERSDYGIL